MNWLKKLFTRQPKKSQQSSNTDELECVAYVSAYIDDNMELGFDMDFQKGAEDVFAQLFFAVNSGVLTEKAILELKKDVNAKGNESLEIIFGIIQELLAEHMDSLGEDFAEYSKNIGEHNNTAEGYKSKTTDRPVVDPCNVFKDNQAGEVQ